MKLKSKDPKEQENPRNRIIITYHKGYLKTFPERGYITRKGTAGGGKTGGKLPWCENYGQTAGRRCTSLEKAKEIAKGLFEQHVREIVYWDKNRQKHELKPRKALFIAKQPPVPK